MSLPESHPDVHDHKGKACPVTGKTHEYCAPQPSDSRSPCPALNVLANYGYVNRDGKDLSAFQIARGLKACYGLTLPLSLFLAYGGFFMLRRIRPITLYEIGKHNMVEHDASLVHQNTPEGHEYAPIEIDQALLSDLMKDFATGKEGGEGQETADHPILMDATCVARARVRREKQSPQLDSVHAEIARGEMAIMLGAWETKTEDNTGVPVEWMRQWIGHERLPDGWKPSRKQGLLDTIKRSKSIREAMERIRSTEANEAKASPAAAASTEKVNPPTPVDHEKTNA